MVLMPQSGETELLIIQTNTIPMPKMELLLITIYIMMIVELWLQIIPEHLRQ